MSASEPDQTDPEHTAVVVGRLTACQGQLFAYIYSLTADADGPGIFCRRGNRLLWRKADDYDPARNFLPWAMAHAFNQVRAARSKQKRERLVFRADATLVQLSEHAVEGAASSADERAIALQNDAGARAQYLDYIAVDAMLRFRAGGEIAIDEPGPGNRLTTV